METEFCEHCKKEIPGVNFVMHLAHCLRNVEICDTCGQAIPKANSLEHFEEFHKTVLCELCGTDIESKAKVEEHVYSFCRRRIVPCVFCELRVPLNELDEHENYCGARTEKCDRCKNFVLIRELENHVCDSQTCNLGNTDAALPCEVCGELIPVSQLMKHQSLCSGIKAYTDTGENFESIEITDGASADLPQGERCNRISHWTGHVSDSDNSIYALPCEICGKLCPSDKLTEHQEQCLQEKQHPQGTSSPGKHICKHEENEEPCVDIHQHHSRASLCDQQTDPEDLFVRYIQIGREADAEDMDSSMAGIYGRRSNIQLDPLSLLWEINSPYFSQFGFSHMMGRPTQRDYFS